MRRPFVCAFLGFFCVVSSCVHADEFDKQRAALEAAYAPFQHYSCTMHLIRYNKDEPAKLLTEATCCFERQTVLTERGHRFWWHDVTETVTYPSAEIPASRVDMVTSVFAGGGPPTYILSYRSAYPPGKQHSGLIVTFQEPPFVRIYPENFMGYHYLNSSLAKKFPIEFSAPDDPNQCPDLLGFTMRYASSVNTVWFSSKDDFYPVISEYTHKGNSPITTTRRLLQQGRAVFRGESIRYPKRYIIETEGQESPKTIEEVEVQAIQFLDFDPEYRPQITFPAGIVIWEEAKNAARTTIMNETYPK